MERSPSILSGRNDVYTIRSWSTPVTTARCAGMSVLPVQKQVNARIKSCTVNKPTFRRYHRKLHQWRCLCRLYTRSPKFPVERFVNAEGAIQIEEHRTSFAAAIVTILPLRAILLATTADADVVQPSAPPMDMLRMSAPS